MNQELKEKIKHYLISTQQDGAGIAMGRKSTDGSPYKSRIDEFTTQLLQLFQEYAVRERIDELKHTYVSTDIRGRKVVVWQDGRMKLDRIKQLKAALSKKLGGENE